MADQLVLPAPAQHHIKVCSHLIALTQCGLELKGWLISSYFLRPRKTSSLSAHDFICRTQYGLDSNNG